mmetsp:Transcript_26620/g.103565  ORF Transcript_26620/g.103565 Transcript_26620/m.103565 type:complete len:210 (+) Transcript_26620:272-901(+)
MAGNLDTNSSFTELCHRCREGDLPAVKDAILSGININARDVWDATPLYYACLTGRSDIVRFLLEAGAVCDVDTFDGERCFYAALNLQVRTLLQTYGDRVLVSHDNRFYRFISSLRVDPSVADFAIFGEDTHEREMLSAAILSARSPALHGFLKRSSDLGRRGYVQVEILSPIRYGLVCCGPPSGRTQRTAERRCSRTQPFAFLPLALPL